MIGDNGSRRKNRSGSHIQDGRRRLVHPDQFQYDERTGIRSLTQGKRQHLTRRALIEEFMTCSIDCATGGINIPQKPTGRCGRPPPVCRPGCYFPHRLIAYRSLLAKLKFPEKFGKTVMDSAKHETAGKALSLCMETCPGQI